MSFAIHNKNVINIALTGGFGTGKSTIINQFCKANRGNEYLHISLASFKDDKSDEKIIETSIVQQILYYEKKAKIKESSYKRIDFTKPIRKFIFISLLTLWSYTIIFLFFEKINEKLVFFSAGNTNIEFIQLIFIVGVFYIFYISYDKIRNIKFSKLTPSSLEIVNEKVDKQLSVFNRNIDEIIYFFEKTNTNVVIVEDIDRFSDDIAIKLYSKIRELSILIKQSKDVVQPVRFIYSVKDELILEDKTKFFDLIIPVIPITDYNNSKNIFLSKLSIFFEKETFNTEEATKESYLDKNFIAEISNYVHDMRTVINICNEFKLYNKILLVDKPNIDKNRLFAIIFYKNIFPEDFAKIQKNNSKLHRVFKKDFKNEDGLKNIISEIDGQLEEGIKNKKSFEDSLSEHIIKDINELRNVYIFNLIGMIKEKFDVDISEIEGLDLDYDLITNENFLKIEKSDNIKFSYRYNENTDSNISFADLEDKVNIDLRYTDRVNLINVFHENKIDLIERKINYLNNEKIYIQKLSLYELYENYNEKIDAFLNLIYNSIVNDKEVINENINLFKYLIKNDYLNEDFIEYTSYFYPGSLSANDHKLMMKINQNEFTSFDEKIENVDDLIKSIRDIRFKNPSILIYDILECLLGNANDHLKKEKLEFLITQIQNYNDQSVYFIEGFLNKINNKDEILSNFYNEITKWDKFWNLVETKFSGFLKRLILFDLLHLFSNDLGKKILVKLNKNKGLTNFINSDTDLLKDIFERITLDSFVETLVLLKVQFYSITPNEKINNLLLKVYEFSLYKISINNLALFSKIDHLYSFNEDEFLNSNFGFLKSKNQSKLYIKILENLNEYIENVYLKIESNINEKAEDILFLLEQNDLILNGKYKLLIIKKGFLGKLENFGKNQSRDIIVSLFEENKVFSSWKNIIGYYNWEGPSTSILTNFLNLEENYINLSIIELYGQLDTLFDGEESCLDFIYSLVNDENLIEESFKTIFADSGDLVLRSNKINIDSRISFLEEKTFFVFDQEEFESLLEKNKDVLVKLIEKNENDFISELDDFDFNIEFIEDLLNSKLSFGSLNAVIIYKEDEIIADQNLEFLQKVSKFYIENKSIKFTSEMFEELITSDLEEDYKIGLFNLAVADENSDYDINDLLEKMGDKFKDMLNDDEVSFEVNEQNQTFLKILEEHNVILDFKKSKNNYIIYYDK